jgi:hypothetical protein
MLLSCSLRDVWKPNDSDIFQGVDWKAIYQTAFSHKVHTLLYPVVKSLEPNNYYIPPGLKEEWEDSVVLNTLRELMKLEEFKDTVSAFNEIGIDIVIYKGIELKDLYRYPELRTMGDIDILVNKIDVEPGSRLLVTMGYKERHREDHVLEYIHDTKKSIELHSSLVNAKRDRQFRFIDDIMWKHIRPGSYMGEKVYQFTPAFHLAFLIIHMFKHFARDGIGLRQLYDICVYASHYENEIDWARFGIFSIKPIL